MKDKDKEMVEGILQLMGAFPEEYKQALKNLLKQIDRLDGIEGVIVDEFGQSSMKGIAIPADFDYKGLAQAIRTYVKGADER